MRSASITTGYAITGLTRAEMVHDKAKLYELGGTLPKPMREPMRPEVPAMTATRTESRIIDYRR